MAREKSFLDALAELDEELEAEESSGTGHEEDFRSDGIGHENPETRHHENQPNSSLESDGNFSASNFSSTTQVASSPATPFSIPSCGSSFDTSTLESLFGSVQGISEDMEVNPTDSFFVPIETTTGEFCGTDDTQSNPFKHWRPVPYEICKNSNPEGDASNCSKEENKPSEMFRRKRRGSTSAPQMSADRGEEKVDAPKMKYRRVMTSASAKDGEMKDASSHETSSVALDSVLDADGVPVAGPSETQVMSHENGKEEQFLCDPSGKDVARKLQLSEHHRSYVGEKDFVCPTCGKRFTQKSNMQKQLLTHPREKTFECDICGKIFSQKANMMRHRLTHTGERTFVCDICDKFFSQKANLMSHRLTHTVLRTLACDICSKKFAGKSILTEHLRIHTVEKPLKCKFCNMSFTQQNHCICHQKKKHGGNK